MAKEKIQLTERQLREITKSVILEAIEDGEIDEGFLSNLWGGVKNAGYKTGQAVAQRGNKLMGDINAGMANDVQKEIDAQIQKSQQIINREQQKINNLRAKQRKYASNADKYINKANTNAQNRGSNTQYNNYNLAQDNRTQDFFNQSDLDKSNFSARMKGAQQAHNKMRKAQQPSDGNRPGMRMPRQAAVNESMYLRNIIREAINSTL